MSMQADDLPARGAWSPELDVCEQAKPRRIEVKASES
jgi:hypothetical protein